MVIGKYKERSEGALISTYCGQKYYKISDIKIIPRISCK